MKFDYDWEPYAFTYADAGLSGERTEGQGTIQDRDVGIQVL